MPKMKTNKSVAKRFKLTKKGKVRRYRAGVAHLNSHKTRKRKRHLRHPVVHEGAQVRMIKRLLGEA
jgi:large subunit ribosomal protein L35